MPGPRTDTPGGGQDPRRRIPRTDTLLRLPQVQHAEQQVGTAAVREVVLAAQDRARRAEITPEQVTSEVLARLPARATSLRPVINATGVVVHTNIGRAPLSRSAIDALVLAAEYVDVEMDLRDGSRSRRGAGAIEALLAACPAAADALVVNNGAAALVLATTALAAGREIVVSRGEMVEIGDGFRLHELIASTGARLREVGTTNRTHLRDYAEAVGPDTGCILKVHPSNFRVEGFTCGASLPELATLGVPVVSDIGSGLLRPDPSLPDEPDAATALEHGATVVTCSGDKLLGGPQAGIVLGRDDVVERLRRHPLQRALRVDKLTLAALEATLRGSQPPVTAYRNLDPVTLRARCDLLADRLRENGIHAEVLEVEARIGGGGAPGHVIPSWAVAVDDSANHALRQQDPAILTRILHGRTVIDLRCVPADQDAQVAAAVVAALSRRAV